MYDPRLQQPMLSQYGVMGGSGSVLGQMPQSGLSRPQQQQISAKQLVMNLLETVRNRGSQIDQAVGGQPEAAPAPAVVPSSTVSQAPARVKRWSDGSVRMWDEDKGWTPVKTFKSEDGKTYYFSPSRKTMVPLAE